MTQGQQLHKLHILAHKSRRKGDLMAYALSIFILSACLPSALLEEAKCTRNEYVDRVQREDGRPLPGLNLSHTSCRPDHMDGEGGGEEICLVCSLLS